MFVVLAVNFFFVIASLITTVLGGLYSLGSRRAGDLSVEAELEGSGRLVPETRRKAVGRSDGWRSGGAGRGDGVRRDWTWRARGRSSGRRLCLFDLWVLRCMVLVDCLGVGLGVICECVRVLKRVRMYPAVPVVLGLELWEKLKGPRGAS